MLLRSVGEGLIVYAVVLFELGEVAVALVYVLRLVVARLCRYQECHHHSGHCGVDAAVVEQRPHYYREENIGEEMLLAQFAEQQSECYDAQGNKQQRQLDGASVEQGYDQDGYEIVGNCEGSQEHLE